jgi:hypothetical protein
MRALCTLVCLDGPLVAQDTPEVTGRSMEGQFHCARRVGASISWERNR